MYFNYFTKEEYSERNSKILSESGYTGGFLTFNQARKLGAKIRKGSKCVARLSRFIDKELNQKTDQLENGFRSYPVFHISQVDFKEEQNDS